MSKPPENSQSDKLSDRQRREKALADALRANLRRRKAAPRPAAPTKSDP